MREINREIASGIILSKDHKLFLGRKDPHSGGVYVDCWHLPGGGVDEGETLLQTALREVKEEVGLDVREDQTEEVDFVTTGQAEKIDKTTGEKMLVHMNFHYFLMHLDTDADNTHITIADDLQSYQWFDLSEIAELKHTPPSYEIFKYLGYLS